MKIPVFVMDLQPRDETQKKTQDKSREEDPRCCDEDNFEIASPQKLELSSIFGIALPHALPHTHTNTHHIPVGHSPSCVFVLFFFLLR